MGYGEKRSRDDGYGAKELCGDFRRGDCSRGDRCKYSHGDGGGGSSGAWGGGGGWAGGGGGGRGGWGGDDGAKKGRTVDKKTCGDFARGKCERGSACKFSHEDLKQSLDDALDSYFGKEPEKKPTKDGLDKLDAHFGKDGECTAAGGLTLDKLDAYFGKDDECTAAGGLTKARNHKCEHPDCTLAVHSDAWVSDHFCCKACQFEFGKEPRGNPAHGGRCEGRTFSDEQDADEKKDAEDKQDTNEKKGADEKQDADQKKRPEETHDPEENGSEKREPEKKKL